MGRLGMTFRSLSILRRIALASSISLLLFAIALLLFLTTDIKHIVYAGTAARVDIAQKVMWDQLRAKGAVSLSSGTLRFGTWIANDDNSVVDRVRFLTGADATIFAVEHGRPMRLATTILNLDGGGRIVHTELTGPARRAFDQGKGFAGISPVAGRPFLNRYDPLRDKTGRVVGIVYTGIPLTFLHDTILQAMRVVLFGTVAGLLASLSLLFAVMRPLRNAFDNMVTVAQGLAAGDVNQHAKIVSESELGQVGYAFQEMINYQQRMAAIADALAAGDFSMVVVPASDRDRLGIAFAHMSDKLKHLVDQLEYSAMTDSLTQLGNRRAFDQGMRAELSRAARHQRTLWLAIVDVDNFKQVNDKNGHQHGDVVLSNLGSVLRGTRSEDFAYRLGGDEFAVVLPDCSESEARLALERLRDRAQASLHGTTVSIGFAGSAAGIVDAETLLRQADAALYLCKQRGRNIVVSFNEAGEIGAMPQQMNVAAVTRLIEERRLKVAFQPIWDMATQSILGFEALTRPDASYGLLGPQEAFDVAGKIGRSHDLDRVCREAAIREAVSLPASTLLFLNTSPQTLARGDLDPDALAAMIADVGLTPDRVVLEITEKYAGPSAPVIAAAVELQNYGFKLALDDTGAGNAGLEYLSRLQVDFIKIDGAIIKRIPFDAASRGVVGALIALAKSTNAYIIAEGVEDAGILQALKQSHGNDLDRVGGLQGYHLGRPGPIESALTDASAVAGLFVDVVSENDSLRFVRMSP